MTPWDFSKICEWVYLSLSIFKRPYIYHFCSDLDGRHTVENNIPLLPQAWLRAWPRRTRRPAKRHVAKKLPELHGNYYSSIKIYKETNTLLENTSGQHVSKLLSDFLSTSYIFLSHFCIYFYQTTMWVFFWRNHYSVLKKTYLPWQQRGKQSPSM